ncbi:MAG TPA: FHA domain-containing protein [Candidatus Angelobacter sp.]|nr:FHA domain-containing protein [Candidatus Angelobacter sp.]
MSELVLTLLRLGFLALIWALVLVTVLVLRRDLRAPRDARPLVATGAAGAKPARSRPERPPKVKTGPRSLVVVEGPLTGTVIPLGTADVTIGRAPDATLVLDDDYASNAHSRLALSNGTWVVTDLGSTNGTWIDRTRITGPTPFTLGHQLKVGRTVLELRR